MLTLRAWLGGSPYTDPVERRVASTVAVIVAGAIVWIGVLEGLYVNRGGPDQGYVHTVALPLLMVAMVVALALLRAGRYRPALRTLVVGLAGPIAFLLAQGLQFGTPLLRLALIVLAVTALTLGRRTLWSVLGLILTALGLGALRDGGLLGGPGPAPFDPPLGDLGAGLLTLLGATVVLDGLASALRDAARAAAGRERALRESEARFRIAFDLSPDAITLSRLRDGCYVAANEGFTRLTGWTEQEMIGHTSVERGIWADPEQRKKLVELFAAGKQVNDAECTFGRKDGSTLVGLISARTLVIDGEPYLVAFTRDVTARRLAEAERAKLQDQLRQAQKLEAIGRLAGGVAHDVNNVLTSVLASAEFGRAALDPSHPAAADLEQIRQDVQRGAELTKQLLTFARRQLVEPKVTRVAERAQAMEPMIRRLVRDGVDLSTRWADDGWAVFIDPSQLEQVILNLVVNARDAMPRGGRLELCTATATLDDGDAAALEVAPGDYVRLSAVDEGVGMEPEVLAHIFEPFFTTKAGRGFGLGLATCYGIVRQAGGAITATSRSGAGSRFDVYLPRTTGPTVATRDAAPVTSTRGHETVLVVEDEPAVRRMAVRALGALGYRVLEADSRAAADAVVADHPGEIHAAVLDVALPDGNGRDVADGLRRHRRGTRLLFVSGYVGDLVGPTGALEPGVTFLPKPYTPAHLTQKLREVLDGPEPASETTASAREGRAG